MSILVSCAIGGFSYVGALCRLECVDIGRYCQLADCVVTLREHPTDWLTSHPFTLANVFRPPYVSNTFTPFQRKPHIVIGNDVRIDHGAKIHMGVTIGNGALIEAGSVVTHDVPPFAIVAGVPARLIRMRLPEQLIARIQQVQWWQYNLIGKQLDWHDPMTALDQIERMVQSGELVPHNPPHYNLGSTPT